MSSLGVVVPTKNSLKYLPDHLAGLRAWVDLAQEVVFVDSYSTDGTLEYIQQNFTHPGKRLVSHPPGLYASWNHGIQQLSTDFCYIATVGDSLTRAGAEHFLTMAQRLQWDVLVSRPRFIDTEGRPCNGPRWPLDEYSETLAPDTAVNLPPLAVISAALTLTTGAVTGSCASDLFRTAILKQFPFPTEFGTAGDGAWSLQNAGRLRWAVTARQDTTFRRHPPTASAAEIQAGKNARRFEALAMMMVSDWLGRNSPSLTPSQVDGLKALLAAAIAQEADRDSYDVLRRQAWPWILNPSAWATRARRNAHRRELAELKAKLLASVPVTNT